MIQAQPERGFETFNFGSCLLQRTVYFNAPVIAFKRRSHQIQSTQSVN
jgi:hypothetical protein